MKQRKKFTPNKVKLLQKFAKAKLNQINMLLNYKLHH
jgi:hypothetical protein